MSDEKKVKSFSVDRTNAEFLSEQDNASALVNDLVEKYRTDGNRELAALELRRQQKARELEQARQEVERLESDLQEITQLIEDADDQENQELAVAAERLPETDNLDTDNPAVENWARKLNLTTPEFLDRLEQHRKENRTQ